MFWNFHFNSSGIDTLLAKEDITLKEILDEEDILQECKTQNSKLLDFLTQEEILKELLHLVVDQPADDVEEAFKYKYKNLACEVITLDIYTILDKIASNKECLDIIWEFAERPPPLNPLIASFFSKVISILICRKGQETFEYLKSHDAVNKFIVHIDISAIMELFMKMVTVVETQELKTEISKWLDDENLIGKLIDLLHPSEQEEKHYNVSQLLSELIRIGRDSISQYVESEDPLLLTLEKKETVDKLLHTMFEDTSLPNSDSSVLSGIATLSSMLEIKRPVIEGMEELITPMDLERIALGVHSTLEVLSSRMQDFYEVLNQFHVKFQMETTFGTLDPPLGKVRLNIAALVCTAVSTNTKIINDAVAQTGIINVLLDLFSRYEWNNFLHTYVQNCIIAILNNECDIANNMDDENESQKTIDPLLKNLFQECNVVSRLMKIWKDNDVTEKSGGNRKGFMGHLTKILNEIVNAKEKGPNHEHIKSMFNELSDETREQWNDLLSNSLAETNQRNLCVPLNSLSHPFESGSDDEEISISQFEGMMDGTLQQAFENYQVQPMTNEFIESFGYDENNVNETENLKNPFDEVGNIDFSINANEESENEKLFDNICEQKIRPFNDSDEEEEEDIWEEKHLTFSSPSQPRQSKNAIRSDSDSSDEESSKSPPRVHENAGSVSHKEEKMEVDSDNENKNWWKADFTTMDVQSNDTSSWPGAESSPTLSTSSEGFADFTDISKFAISGENEKGSPPVDMETEGLPKPNIPSVYEVKMEEDNPQPTNSESNVKAVNTQETTKDTSVSPRLTQITIKSVRSPAVKAQEAKSSTSNETTNTSAENTSVSSENTSTEEVKNNIPDSPAASSKPAISSSVETPVIQSTTEHSTVSTDTSATIVSDTKTNTDKLVVKDTEKKPQGDDGVVVNGPSSVDKNTESSSHMT